jgi:pimeloyl-ACP methyl ester carboxylesterase
LLPCIEVFRAFSLLVSTAENREVWLFLTESHDERDCFAYTGAKTLQANPFKKGESLRRRVEISGLRTTHYQEDVAVTVKTQSLKVSQTLKVPGAQIYYEVYGSGPILLMIPGGPADAGVFTSLARSLSDRYTAVPCDPRGNSRSVLDRPVTDLHLNLFGDDAAQLLAALGDEPAYVLGSSGGAQIGLNLAARYPGRVRMLVAHEPPCLELLPDAEEHRASGKELDEIYKVHGAGAAMQKFMASAGLDAPPPKDAPPPPPEMQEAFGRVMGNLDFFFAHGRKAIVDYVPDVAALKAGAPQIVVGVGKTTTGQTANRAAVALAERLGVDPVVFPGDHGGYGSHPAAFAERLDQAFKA